MILCHAWIALVGFPSVAKGHPSETAQEIVDASLANVTRTSRSRKQDEREAAQVSRYLVKHFELPAQKDEYHERLNTLGMVLDRY